MYNILLYFSYSKSVFLKSCKVYFSDIVICISSISWPNFWLGANSTFHFFSTFIFHFPLSFFILHFHFLFSTLVVVWIPSISILSLPSHCFCRSLSLRRTKGGSQVQRTLNANRQKVQRTLNANRQKEEKDQADNHSLHEFTPVPRTK